MRAMFRRVCVMGFCAVALAQAQTPTAPAGPTALDVPMDRRQVSVLIRFGLTDKEPSTWTGSYSASAGRVVATAGWRFTGNDCATVSEFNFQTRKFFPRFWKLRGRDPKTFPVQSNGFIVTVAGVTPTSVLQVTSSRGDFTVPVGSFGYGGMKLLLDKNVDVTRVPTHRHIVRAPTEDGCPSAVLGEDGRLRVCYLAFTHGKGFERRPPMPKKPDDYSFLAVPTGGDQLMVTEMQGDGWSEPTALTEPGGDLFGTAIAIDGAGRTWVFWSANVDGNWDLYGAYQAAGAWSAPLRLTTAPGTDFRHVAATDSAGRIWLAWQRLNAESSDIMVSRQRGLSFGEAELVAGSDANEWAPALATAGDGRVAVAWDSYERGNYDVMVRVWAGGTWGARRDVVATAENEARPSAAFDAEGRLWLAYEVNPEGWGKDFGPYDQSPKRMPLYRSRKMGLRILVGEELFTTEKDVNLGMPMPEGNRRWAKSPKRFLVAGPQVTRDGSGRIWVSGRVKIARFDSVIGGTWLTFLTTLDGENWRAATVVPGTDGLLHESGCLVPASDSGLYVVATSDGRRRTGAAFGLGWKQAQRTGKDLPPRSTRQHVRYPDWAFNREIVVADTGRVRRPDKAPVLVPVAGELPAEAVTVAVAAEREQVAAIRAYRVDLNGESLQILRGEFHRHTEISSDGAGDGTIWDMWRYGMDMAALDWLGSGDHDNGSGREFPWWLTQKTTSLTSMPGVFTPMYTYERSCNYPDGHRNAVFAQRGIRPLNRLQKGKGKIMDDLPPDAARPNTPDTQMFYEYLRVFDGVCASHTSGTDMGTDWRDHDPKVEPIVEIYQGDRQNYERPGAPRTNTDQYSIGGWRPLGFVSRALLKGYRLGFQSSSDHISTHMSYCNVFVAEPTREAILDAMKKRRVYGATDNIIADVRCGEHFMGEEFSVDAPPVLQVKLIGTAPFAEVVIVKDNEYVYSTAPHTKEVAFEWTDTEATPGKTSYYYVRGTQEGETQTRKVRSPKGERVDVEVNNGEIVWVSPMWITLQP